MELQDERLSMRLWYADTKFRPATVVVEFRRAGSNAVEVANTSRPSFPTVQAQLPKLWNRSHLWTLQGT